MLKIFGTVAYSILGLLVLDILTANDQLIWQDDDYEVISRRLNHDHHLKSHLGRQDLLSNISVSGAVITNDPELRHLDSASMSSSEFKEKSHLFETFQHIKNLSSELPFSLTYWPRGYSKPCPKDRRNVAVSGDEKYSHLQIWLDFVFFDHDVLISARRGIEGRYNSTWFSSTSSSFAAINNGTTLLREEIPFLENDIIVIFEDTAFPLARELNISLVHALNNMHTDLLNLGCGENLTSFTPSSYALTRAGARKLARLFEPCGSSLRDQITRFYRHHWLTVQHVQEVAGTNESSPCGSSTGRALFGSSKKRASHPSNYN